VLAWVPEQLGGGPLASAVATPSVYWMMKAWIAAWSLLEGHWPLPSVSARPHLSENFASHLLKTGVPSALFAALAFAFSRQEQYFPAVLSSPDAHLPAGASAHALAPISRTPAKAAVVPAIAVALMP
jgi:hypothetical protein